MAEKVKLLNGVTISFENSGIKVSYNENILNIPYADPGRLTYVSLIILTAKESNLYNARRIIAKYEGLVPIREIIMVGNSMQKPENIQTSKRVKFVVHRKKQTPIITSVKEALSCISSFSQLAIVCPANKAFIEKDKLETVLKAVIANYIKFAVPFVNGRRTHPIVVSRSGFEEIKSVRKELGFKHISKKLFTEVTV